MEQLSLVGYNMYVDYIMQVFESSSTIRASLMFGGNMIFQNDKLNANGVNNRADYISGQEVLQFDRIAQNRVYGPLAVNIKPVRYEYLDTDTLEYSDNNTLVHIAGRLGGGFTALTLPIRDYSLPTITGDLMGSCFINAMLGRFSLSYSYLRSAQLFMSMNQDVTAISDIQADDNRTNVHIKLDTVIRDNDTDNTSTTTSKIDIPVVDLSGLI